MFLLKYIRRLFLAAFPRPVLLRPLSQASFPPAALLDHALLQPEPFKLWPVLASAALEPNLGAPSLLSRFRIGPYANGPP
jgi:hypothetical protein